MLSDIQEEICRLTVAGNDIKAFALINEYSMRALTRYLAINKVHQNSGKTPGIDEITIANDDEKLQVFQKTNKYRIKKLPPMQVRYVEIPKPNGQTRGLGISNIIDRVLQTQLCILLDPYYEAKLPEHMYGFRKGRGALQAAAFLRSVLDRAFNPRFGLILLDIEKCFDNISHDAIKKYYKVPTV